MFQACVVCERDEVTRLLNVFQGRIHESRCLIQTFNYHCKSRRRGSFAGVAIIRGMETGKRLLSSGTLSRTGNGSENNRSVNI